eukprot:UN02192
MGAEGDFARKLIPSYGPILHAFIFPCNHVSRSANDKRPKKGGVLVKFHLHIHEVQIFYDRLFLNLLISMFANHDSL